MKHQHGQDQFPAFYRRCREGRNGVRFQFTARLKLQRPLVLTCYGIPNE